MSFQLNPRPVVLATRLCIVFATCCLIAAAGIANASSTYDAFASVSISLESADGLVNRGSTVRYSASAQATADGTTEVDLADQTLSTTSTTTTTTTTTTTGTIGTPSTTSTTSTAGSGASLDSASTNWFLGQNPPSFLSVDATEQGAFSRGGNDYSGSVFSANVNGHATDPVEFANSRVRWDLLIAFENTSDVALTLNWSIAYLLRGEAHADPRGSAFANTRVQFDRGTIVGGARISEGTFKVEGAACGVSPLSCSLASTLLMPGTKDFSLNLAAGAIGFLNVEVLADGNASVVPVPAALPLYSSVLAVAGFFGWRKKRVLAAPVLMIA